MSANPFATEKTSGSTILPGATIGMVGGGQLGRMFAMAAMRMGYDVIVFCNSDDEPAAQVATRTLTGNLDDRETVAGFARQCDVISLEFENIPASSMQICSEHAATYPSHHVLATAQDRFIEKQTFRNGGLDVTPFAAISNQQDVVDFAEQHGWPIIVKTARSGYDGKGQYRVESRECAADVPWQSTEYWVAEKWIPFKAEVSVIVARSSQGEIRCFPPLQNHHVNHILDTSVCPSFLSASQAKIAVEIATSAARILDLVGLLCVEMFVVDAETLLINEVAPRPHNSGHLTIEACFTSQFEQHVRAVCGLPLGDPNLRVPGAAMANLLGDLWQPNGSAAWDQLLLAEPGVALHLYGKREPRVGRKMGHLTSTAETPDLALQQVCSAREKLVRNQE